MRYVYRNELLKLALPLVRTHGFTREALSRSVLALPKPHPEPLRDTAVSALFGEGDDARRTLINLHAGTIVDRMGRDLLALTRVGYPKGPRPTRIQ